MPPKVKGPQKVSKKVEEKQKQKIIEDKTFGLKNKNKSAVVQKKIKGITQQVKGPVKGGDAALVSKDKEKKEEKKKTAAEQALLASLFKTVTSMPKGADGDTKSQICSFYKQGLCAKGNKCKFSHDLSSEEPAQTKPDLYTDPRDLKTDIICKFFLEAVESDKYGWFWKCPNGDECIYRHALPPGYILKTSEELKEEEPEEEAIPLEDWIEQERAKLPPGGTPVTLETLNKWKEEKKKAKEEAEEKRREAEERKTGGRGLNVLSGRAMFKFDPSLFMDDENAYDKYEQREEEDEGEEEKGEDSDNQSESEEPARREREADEGIEETDEVAQEEAGENKGKEEPERILVEEVGS